MAKRAAPRRTSTRQSAVAKGFRSGLEDKVSGEMNSSGISYTYEQYRIAYEVPAREAKYTPDFLLLGNGIIIETKGQFLTEDRKKHLLIKAQRPGLEIRFVFSNSRTRISKQSQTTYGKWCDTHGFLYADRSIPLSWFAEPSTFERLEANAKFLIPITARATSK